MNLLITFILLSILNVTLQTVKSLCTVRCSTLISASVNAIAYGVYTYVIFFMTSDGLPLWGKALITATANFIGVYAANYAFDALFKKTVRWKVECSVPFADCGIFEQNLKDNNFEWYTDGGWDDWRAYSVFCPTRKESATLKSILPSETKYNIVECVKRL